MASLPHREPRHQAVPHLPFAAPAHPTAHLLLIAMRRMAAQGLHDASAALLMLQGFGIHFRKPLVLLRAYVMELSQSSLRSIMVAPCCSPRMTLDEARILGALANAHADRTTAVRHLHQLTDNAATGTLLTTATTLAATLVDLGRALPLSLGAGDETQAWAPSMGDGGAG